MAMAENLSDEKREPLMHGEHLVAGPNVIPDLLASAFIAAAAVSGGEDCLVTPITTVDDRKVTLTSSNYQLTPETTKGQFMLHLVVSGEETAKEGKGHKTLMAVGVVLGATILYSANRIRHPKKIQAK